MSQKPPEALERHASIPVLMEPRIRAAIREGRFSLTFGGSTPAERLLRVYRRHAEYLLRLSTPYAMRLQAEALAFCIALADLPPKCPIAALSIGFEDGHSIDLFERADTRELVGALHIVDRAMVSDGEWDELWGTG
jgi:hypothetical protein